MLKEHFSPVEKAIGTLGAASTIMLVGCPDVGHPQQPPAHQEASPAPTQTPDSRQGKLQELINTVEALEVPTFQYSDFAYRLRSGTGSVSLNEIDRVTTYTAVPDDTWKGYSETEATASMSVAFYNRAEGFLSLLAQPIGKPKDGKAVEKNFTFITPESKDIEFISSGYAGFRTDLETLEEEKTLILRSKNWAPTGSYYSAQVATASGDLEKAWEKWAQLPSSRRFKLMDGTFVDITLEEPQLTQ